MNGKVLRTDAEWRLLLTPLQYEVMREAGTERAYTSPLHANREPGIYRCAGCSLDLFHSHEKYDSGSGWPSFTAPLDQNHVDFSLERHTLETLTEVHCDHCGSHLGHVYADGPGPSGLRYCINGVALQFEALN